MINCNYSACFFIYLFFNFVSIDIISSRINVYKNRSCPEASYSAQLRRRFPESKEAKALAEGKFD